MILLMQATESLNTAGLIFMVTCWTITIGLTAYCFYRILKIGNKLPDND